MHNVVSCPDYFSHAEGKNSLANGLFNFCSKCHNGGAPIRLHQLKRYQETKPGRTREQPAKECQDFCELAVCVSELDNWQCDVPVLSNVDKIVSRLSEVDRGFMFCESSFLGVRKFREG